MTVEAKVILDSEAPDGSRLTTIEATMHRFVLAELNTHRVFSRNSASSRAIPIDKQIERLLENPAIPVEFGTNQPGMQAGAPLGGHEAWLAKQYWLDARNSAISAARALADLGVHKQVTNRLLEPFMWHTVIVTATDWDGFWEQRCSVLAQPEIKAVADAMQDAYNNSIPQPLRYGEWHTPYIQPEEDHNYWCRTVYRGEDRTDWVDGAAIELRKRVSAARCARVSYLTHDGRRDTEKDLELYERLVTADPPHWSPLEHVATPCDGGAHVCDALGSHLGNFDGWDQLRHMI